MAQWKKELYWASGCQGFLLPVLITNFVKERRREGGKEGDKEEGKKETKQREETSIY